MTVRPLLMIMLFAGGLALSACGKTGELEQPAPLFGAQAKADYDAKRAADANARARDAEARRQNADGTPLDPTAQPMTQAPFSPPLIGRSDPGGPAPGASGAPDQ